MRKTRRVALVVIALAVSFAHIGRVSAQRPESTSCGSNIVSGTVVATFCSHVSGTDQLLDLLILWRGAPGWFQEAGGRRAHRHPSRIS
jgi:hypothetical protein